MSSETSLSPDVKPADLLPVATIRRVLLRIVIFFCLAGLASEIAKYVIYDDRPYWAQMFSLSYEQNFPTWWSASQLFVCGAVLAAIALVEKRRGARYVPHWWGLSLMFIYISVDEMLSFHEHTGDIVETGGGWLYFSWIVPAAIVVGMIGVLYLRFLWHLPVRTRVQFIVAGSIFVGGAMLMELPLGYWTDHYGRSTLGYGLIDVIEETMELMGAALFLSALVEFFLDRIGGGGAARG